MEEARSEVAKRSEEWSAEWRVAVERKMAFPADLESSEEGARRLAEESQELSRRLVAVEEGRDSVATGLERSRPDVAMHSEER